MKIDREVQSFRPARPGRFFVSLALAVVASAGATVALAASNDGSQPHFGPRFDNYFLKKTPPGDLIIYAGSARQARVGANGATDSNRDWEAGLGPLVVESQKVGYQLVRAGVASDDPTLVEMGLKALQWGLRPEVLGADASFPEERDYSTTPDHALHPRSIYVDSAAHSVVVIRQSALSAEIKARAEAMVPDIHRAASSFVNSGDADKFINSSNNSSQMAFIAEAIHLAGLIAGDTALTEIAKGYMEYIISLQAEDGAFLEKGGFDTSYQLNTLELTVAYASTITDRVWQNRVMRFNDKGSKWFLSRVRPDGSIDSSGNTRTEACRTGAIMGAFPKGLDLDAIPIRLYYYAYIAGKVGRIGPVADQIQFLGQRYDHIGHCND